MSSESKVDVREYLPIRFGWLKVLAYVVPAWTWIKLFHWFVYINPDPVHFHPPYGLNPDVLIGMIILHVLLGWLAYKEGLPRKAVKFFWDYFRKNVIGRTAYFFIKRSSGALVVWCEDRPADNAPVGYLVWRAPLGGWLRRKPQLRRSTEVDAFVDGNDTIWKKADWNLYFLSRRNNSFDDCAKIEVTVKACFGDSALAKLGDALSFPDTYRYISTALENGLRQQNCVTGLTSLVESAITDIENSKRFGNSAAGMAIKRRLDSELSSLVPERERRYANQTEAAS